MAQIGTDIVFAGKLLKEGEIVGIPTETVYGLAGNALHTGSILKIFEAKNRPKFDPLIAHIPSIEAVSNYVSVFPEKARELAKTFWPGPLTLLLPKKEIIPDLLTSGSSRVAIRVPNHPLTLKLLQGLDFPLAAPSANPFGYVSPTNSSHVNDQLGDKIPYILNGGSSSVGIESSIIGFDQDTPVVHRLGGLTLEQIEEVIGEVNVQLNQSSNPAAPGMLKSHYSPGKDIVIGDITELLSEHKNKRLGLLPYQTRYEAKPIEKQIVLSSKGDLNEAASNLFGALRELDKANIDVIIGEYVPNEGIGRAINDRLRRAESK